MSKSDLRIAEAIEGALAGDSGPCLPEFADWPHAAANLRCIAKRFEGHASPKFFLADLTGFALKSPAPNSAINNYERFAETAFEVPFITQNLLSSRTSLGVLASVFGSSQFLSDVLIRNPDFFAWLVQPENLHAPRSLAEYRREVRAVLDRITDRDQLKDALCRLRRRELLRTGTRDILRLAQVEEVTREISNLAQALIEAAAQIAYDDAVARFGLPMCDAFEGGRRECSMCVIGMGKLGGRELNFSSDIDLIFIYDEEGQTTGLLPGGRKTGPQTNHVFFTRMGENLIRFLSERGPEGNLFRVDMRLRPEGAGGPLVRSLESFANYLSQQGRDWERLAYLKARVLAGPSQLAERLYRVTQEFVYAGVAPTRIVREVENLKLMIDREVMQSDVYRREVKRGYGGIREIEFVIAAMQIIHGKTHRALHVRNIFTAIQRLHQVGLLSAEEHAFYLRAYRFLRLVEHRLQMAEEHQTHTVPESAAGLELMARRCHFDSARSFTREYQLITEGVHQRFMRFFEQDQEAADRESRDMLLILDTNAPRQEAMEALARRGISDPGALDLIHELAFGTREVFISAEGQRYFEQMLPSLLRMAAKAALPERVLPHLHSFVLAIKGITYYYELIAQHPDILNLLVSLFGTSGHFSRVMIAHPQFFDMVLSSDVLYRREKPEEQLGRVRAAAGAARGLDRRLVLLRRAAQFETLLSALRSILRLRTVPETCHGLSQTADVFVAAAMELAAERLAERFGSRLGVPEKKALAKEILGASGECFAVAALGKYGGQEINFFSDLDVVFVYDERRFALEIKGDAVQPAEFFAVLSDALVYVLSENLEGGRAFVLDARLRPHGKNSPIATPLSLYVQYIEREAQIWEMQSLLRCRHVHGNEEITSALISAARTRRLALDPAVVREETVKMRKRLEATVEESARRTQEFKRGLGGIVDVEFVLQYLALAGALPEEALAPNYFNMLDRMADCALPSPELVTVLRTGYSVLRAVETSVRLVTGASVDALPEEPSARAAVEIFFFGRSSGSLPNYIGATLGNIRSAYNAVMEQNPAPGAL